KQGDTLWGIANDHGVSVESILRLNRGLSASNLKVGNSIRIK
ncbi:MAG: LysM peptidoglycan-binding domain-containing protein, partial [Bacteroidetes bacterium]